MKLFLSFAFAWNGVVFFLVFTRNSISMFIGAPTFLVVAILFSVDVFTNRTKFGLPDENGKEG